ncbi:MAG TPA: YraN family protein [Xanthobacteraceae bacterium]|jgi:putative endonuclease|nr:YraN family protein [Xanthobacteraceae bacterium]
MAPRAQPLKAPQARPNKSSKISPAKTAPRPDRVAAFKLGLSAESRAAMLLIAKAYRILARRWKTPFGEVDIVARRRHTLVFVEVKARASADEAIEAVTERSQQRIIKAAEMWLAHHPNDGKGDVRFDVIVVTPGKMPQHIPNAFDASR